MPAIAAVPWLIPLLTAASAATTIGVGVDELLSKPSSGPTAQQQAATKAAQTLAQQKAAFLSNQANGTAPSSANPSPGTPSPEQIQAMMKLLNPGATGSGSNGVQISGGIGGSTPPPQSTNGLTNLAV